jgi:hypothetical protein
MANGGRVHAVIVVPEAVQAAMPKAVGVTVVATGLRVVEGAEVVKDAEARVAAEVGVTLHKGCSLDLQAD